MNEKLLKQIRQALADYMRSEGCRCCQNVDEHDKAAVRLAKLLKVEKYKDGGYNFLMYSTKEVEKAELEKRLKDLGDTAMEII